MTVTTPPATTPVAQRLTLIRHWLWQRRRRGLEVIACLGLVVAMMAGAWLVSPETDRTQAVTPTGVDVSLPHHYRARVLSPGSVQLLEGHRAGDIVPLAAAPNRTMPPTPVGSTIIVSEPPDQAIIHYYDRYRLPGLAIVIGIFLSLVALIGRRRGLMAVAGLAVSVVVIGWGIVPLILAGWPAFWACLAGAAVIATVSVTLAHGWRRRTRLAIVIILGLLLLTSLLAQAAVAVVGLTGLGDEAAYYFARSHPTIDLAGVMAGSIIIATLGVLDDIVTAQVAVVDELLQTRPDLSRHQVIRRALSVGHEHISALINTLALAYVGASLPSLLAIAASSYGSGFLWINGEYIASEIVRTLATSSALLIAVPVSTWVAVLVWRRARPS